jgi:hypothetical protein
MTTRISALQSVVFGQTSYTIDSGSPITFAYDTTTEITNSNVGGQILTVSFESGIVLTSSLFFIRPMSSNITFDGMGNSITIGVSGWNNLFTNTNNNVRNLIIQNLSTIPNSSTRLNQGAGYFIVGSRNFTIRNCWNSCTVNGGTQNNGDNCAIAGNNCVNVVIEYCYNIGTIGGWGASGILGGNTTDCTVSYCYNLGRIGQSGGTGICRFGTRLSITGCYSVAVCDSGGRMIETSGTTTTTMTISNCYTLNGPLLNASQSHVTVTNCYQADGTWRDASANALLTGCPTGLFSPGTIWTSIVTTNSPYLLSKYNYIQTYTPNIVTVSSTQGSSYISGNGSFTTPFTYRLQNVNNTDPATESVTIDQNNGSMIFSNLDYFDPVSRNANVFTTLGTTNLWSGYNFSIFSLILSPSFSTINANNSIEILSSTQYIVDGGSIQTFTLYPVSINQNPGQSGPLTVSFLSNIIYTDIKNYFICGTSNIVFDGQGNNISISGVSEYQGLILNGTTQSNGKDNITLKNIIISSQNNSTLSYDAGWLCEVYFGKGAINNLINNCYSNGTIEDGCGGICGAYTGANSGQVNISSCYSIGSINSGGGICGEYTGANSGQVNISNCYSIGTIEGGGGICGAYTGSNSGLVNITDCYSGGSINNGGGICDEYTGINSGRVNITNCYSIGSIQGGGGICDGSISGTVIITNCYFLNGNI